MPRRTNPANIEAAEKVAKALQLRSYGMTYQEIADSKWKGGKLFNGDRSNARRAVVSGMKQIVQEPAEEVLQMELMRLDNYLRVLGARIARGDDRAVSTALKVGEQRAKLLGLYKPTQIETSGDGVINVAFSPALTPQGGMAEPEIELDGADA
ncbi:helix-turn-helix DNA-binding domain protein [Arthrobacter phage Abba]|uniref:Helix-turn-helix DNA-binding domain protein n=1 Tax=Arthrobacter phage Abba TaxID=2713256 RepID=A0A6G8R299_9CAUD|nr:Rnase E [Arthrobacter phage Abba]QIN94330.1 helix-turn-helix DNA-binding domain protein [Arthrobacter phage Abba]